MIYVINDNKIINKIKKEYMAYKKIKDICLKFNITENEFKNLKKVHKWKRDNNKAKSLSHKGNKNAVGNKGGTGPPLGSKNALVTGEHETINIFGNNLTEEEKQLIELIDKQDKKTMILNELKTYTVREHRIILRIEEIKKGSKGNKFESTKRRTLRKQRGRGDFDDEDETIIETEAVADKILRLEESLTKVQEAKRRCLDTYHKIEMDESKFELDLLRLEREVAADEPPDHTNDNKDSNNLIEALNIKAKVVWEND